MKERDWMAPRVRFKESKPWGEARASTCKSCQGSNSISGIPPLVIREHGIGVCLEPENGP